MGKMKNCNIYTLAKQITVYCLLIEQTFLEKAYE